MDRKSRFRWVKSILFFLLFLTFSFLLRTEGAAAPSKDSQEPVPLLADYLNERLEFDSQGNLIMTTRDRIATGSITYQTIGWTIKRYNGGIFEPWNECAYIALTSLAQVPDPEDPNYCYTTFFCDKNTIFNAIGKVSPQWQESLYQSGGTVYLDGIMTVCHNGTPLGFLTESPPAYTGTVYFYYEDIANAEHWSNPDSLMSHFNKSLAFPANPSLLKETSYQVSYMERTADGRMLSLARYGKDTSGSLKDWSSQSFPYWDFSSHYFVFDHSSVCLTYYDGHQDNLAYTNVDAVTVTNPTGQIAHINVVYYYRRVNLDSYLEQRYLLTQDGKLSTTGTVRALASQSNLQETEENYDVLQGIPGGAYIDLTAEVSPYAYQALFRHCYGEFTCAVTIATTYRLVWTDESGPHEEPATLTETYYEDRAFSFYCLSQYTIYRLQGATFLQNALDTAFQTVSVSEPISTLIQKDGDTTHHYTLPTTVSLTIDGGTLTGNGSRPQLPANAMQAKAHEAIGQIQVTNDLFQIGADLLLDNTPSAKEAPAPGTPSQSTQVTLRKQDCMLSSEKQNSDLYTTSCFVHYKSLDSEDSLTRSFYGNHVVLHTPVVCDTKITDDKKFNQERTPVQDRATLVLGRSFTLLTACQGFHSSLPGYGSRDYSKYAEAICVRFPFPVYAGDTLLPENTWHTISSAETLYLPTGVSEGLYEIEVRVLAKNTPETANTIPDSYCQAGANRNRACTVASTVLPVCVTGRLFDFSLSVEASAFRVGIQDQDGIRNGNRLSSGFPAVGASFYSDLPFTLKTIGNPPKEGDYLELIPSFFYVDEQGQNRQSVDLYLLKEDDTLEKYTPTLRLYTSAAVFSGSVLRNVPQKETAEKSVQTWSGTFRLPSPLVVVPSGTALLDALDEKGSLSLKDSCFLQKGFLIVNFTITYKRTSAAVLSYINSINAGNGYCNMWKTEGFTYSRTDASGNLWKFTDGDTLLFSLDKKRKVYTTH